MGVEDLSLDDIIKERKAARKKAKATDMYSDTKTHPKQTFQKKRLFTAKNQQQGDVPDARLLIRSKPTVTDARQKIKPKAILDARQKLEEKYGKNHNLTKTTPQSSGNGSIPKVTISNEFARKRPFRTPQITFHVTPNRNSRASIPSTRKQSNSSHNVQQAFGSGIKIAVKNELATQIPTSRGRFSPPQPKKTFEKLKITTVNKDAIKREPPSPEPSRTRPQTIRKRALPEDSDDSYDEAPTYAKQRRQQRFEEESREEMHRAQQHSKRDNSTLRPMISRQRALAKQIPISDEEEMEIEIRPSPIEGTKLKVFNLHPVVTEDDILELFSVLGAVRRARLVKPGEADVVYIKHENAFAAYKKYNNRDLDGQPMQIKFLTNEKPKPIMYSWMKDVKSSRKKVDIGDVTELHSGVLQQALFKGGSTGTSTRPVVFTVKI